MFELVLLGCAILYTLSSGGGGAKPKKNNDDVVKGKTIYGGSIDLRSGKGYEDCTFIGTRFHLD